MDDPRDAFKLELTDGDGDLLGSWNFTKDDLEGDPREGDVTFDDFVEDYDAGFMPGLARKQRYALLAELWEMAMELEKRAVVTEAMRWWAAEERLGEIITVKRVAAEV